MYIISPLAFSDLYFCFQELLDKLAQENKQINILEAQIEVGNVFMFPILMSGYLLIALFSDVELEDYVLSLSFPWSVTERGAGPGSEDGVTNA